MLLVLQMRYGDFLHTHSSHTSVEADNETLCSEEESGRIVGSKCWAGAEILGKVEQEAESPLSGDGRKRVMWMSGIRAFPVEKTAFKGPEAGGRDNDFEVRKTMGVESR